MSLKLAKARLPKSVKVRSTCNACQQAKIRCNHEKPSCHRCQKHNIDCVYSVSRRLGRPAKMKESRTGLDDETLVLIDQPERKKMRKSTRKKPHVLTQEREEGQSIQCPADDGFEIDLTHNWLQELMPVHSSILHADFELDVEDSLERLPNWPQLPQFDDMSFSNPLEEPTLAPTCLEQELDIFPISVSESYDVEEFTVPAYEPSRMDMQSFQAPWASSISLLNSSNFCQHYQPPDTLRMTSTSCACYQQAMDELTKAGLRMRHDGTSSIDSILASQKDLSLQTETILQCKMCSQSEIQVNMLMTIIVTIDSLLTTLDATTLPGKLEEESERLHAGPPINMAATWFKSSVDACPLLVGEYRVPVEGKASFIRQVLQFRLSKLLLTVRRIRVCIQSHLSGPSSRGRLFKIIETDRRLQLMIRRI